MSISLKYQGDPDKPKLTLAVAEPNKNAFAEYVFSDSDDITSFARNLLTFAVKYILLETRGEKSPKKGRTSREKIERKKQICRDVLENLESDLGLFLQDSDDDISDDIASCSDEASTDHDSDIDDDEYKRSKKKPPKKRKLNSNK